VSGILDPRANTIGGRKLPSSSTIFAPPSPNGALVSSDELADGELPTGQTTTPTKGG
jgi:hypothetical protein